MPNPQGSWESGRHNLEGENTDMGEKRCPPLLTRGGKRRVDLEEWLQPAPSLRTQTRRRSSPQLGGGRLEGEGRNPTLPRSLCSGLSARLSGCLEGRVERDSLD